MSKLLRLQNDILSLSAYEVRELLSFLEDIFATHFMPNDMHTQFKEHRFSNGQACIHCGSVSVVKNGKLGNKQHYKCKDCKKHFNNLSLSALSGTKLPLNKWMEYAKCMLFGFSIRKCAALVDVCVKTSFYMRHFMR